MTSTDSSSSLTTPAAGAAFAIDGISVQGYSEYAYAGPVIDQMLQEAATDGANYVELSSASLVNLTTGVITDDTVGTGNSEYDNTTSWSDVVKAVAQAEADGLNVVLKPQLETIDPYDGDPYGDTMWDPRLVISNPAAFFANYKAYIMKWAELAQEYHVGILCIGNEMNTATLPQYTPYWTDIIASIRSVYSGKLTYSALYNPSADGSLAAWDEAAHIQFWNQLDYVGLDVYPPLSSAANASVSQLTAGWSSTDAAGVTQDYITDMASLAAETGKPILFTETGAQSVLGANTSTPKTSIVNDAAQTAYWQSLFDALAVNPPAWMAGILAWGMSPTDTGGNWATSFDVNGKPAEAVIASYFGGSEYIAPAAAAFTGSQGDDRIFLYGDTGVAAATATTRAATYSTTISIEVDSTIINGIAPTLELYVNGKDMGATVLTATPGFYTDSEGVQWTTDQYISVTLTGLVKVSQLKLAMTSPLGSGAPENQMVYVDNVSINGVAIDSATYTNTTGGVSTQGQYSMGLFYGGADVFNCASWNASEAKQTKLGTAADPISVHGDGGDDVINLLGPRADYTIRQTGADTIVLTAKAGLNEDCILTGIETLAFADKTIFVESAAGSVVARLYQASVGGIPDATGLYAYEDQLTAHKSLSAIAGEIASAPAFATQYGGMTNGTFVSDIYEAATGRAPPASTAATYLAQMTKGATQATILLEVCETAAAATHDSPWLFTLAAPKA